MIDMVVRVIAAVQAHRRDGQAMVEYALILALISVVCIAMLTLVGTDVNLVFNNIAIKLGGAV